MSKENEGEFKKRLREELHFCNAIDSSCAEVSPSETKENLYKIFKVLDEARKNLLEGSHFEGDDTDATTAICKSEFEKLFIELFGERCKTHQKGCPCCDAWAKFDAARKDLLEKAKTGSDIFLAIKRCFIENTDGTKDLLKSVKVEEWDALNFQKYVRVEDAQKELSELMRENEEKYDDLLEEYNILKEKTGKKERSLRKLWEDFDLDNYDNDDVIEWYNESKKIFGEAYLQTEEKK